MDEKLRKRQVEKKVKGKGKERKHKKAKIERRGSSEEGKIDKWISERETGRKIRNNKRQTVHKSATDRQRKIKKYKQANRKADKQTHISRHVKQTQ